MSNFDAAQQASDTLRLAAERGWRENPDRPRGEYQWLGPDGELSPRYNQWEGFVRWMTERLEREE